MLKFCFGVGFIGLFVLLVSCVVSDDVVDILPSVWWLLVVLLFSLLFGFWIVLGLRLIAVGLNAVDLYLLFLLVCAFACGFAG